VQFVRPFFSFFCSLSLHTASSTITETVKTVRERLQPAEDKNSDYSGTSKNPVQSYMRV